ncbi:MAG TPA: ubiquitin-like small modifier protein 1 [Acidimicrobiia bacterium]|jgi:molybdopterin converting factor small subunit|nr:ubiquitin-like small modifier protein 1 [Acidimicrobiia bacterium]
MPVEVRLPTILRSHAGGAPSVTVEGSTVGELFDGLVAKYPGLKGQLVTDSGDLHKFVNVYRNDDDIRYTGRLDTPVEDNDVVSIIPAVAGG